MRFLEYSSQIPGLILWYSIFFIFRAKNFFSIRLRFYHKKERNIFIRLLKCIARIKHISEVLAGLVDGNVQAAEALTVPPDPTLHSAARLLSQYRDSAADQGCPM